MNAMRTWFDRQRFEPGSLRESARRPVTIFLLDFTSEAEATPVEPIPAGSEARSGASEKPIG
jgi:hypothetical protein